MLTHKDTGRIYIGQSINYKNRIKNYKALKNSKRNNTYIEHAIKKYGWDSFDAKLIIVAEDKSYLDLLEINAIKIFNCVAPNGFNLREGGNTSTISEESRKKMSETRKKKIADGTIVYPKNATRPKLTDEHKKKVGEASKKMWSDPEYKVKMKIILSAVAKKRWENPEYRAKVLAAKGVC